MPTGRLKTSRFTAEVSAVHIAVESPPRSLIALLSNVPILLAEGWRSPLLPVGMLHAAQAGLVVVYLALLFMRGRSFRKGSAQRMEFVRTTWPERLAGSAALVLLWSMPAAAMACAALTVIHIVRTYLFFARRGTAAPLMFVGSFLSLIAVGTGALMLPAAAPADKPVSLVDAIFTATSAACVTGLVVRDTGTEFTRFGQTIILILIQAGGLGIVLLGSFAMLLAGSSLGLRAQRTIAEMTSEEQLRNLNQLVASGLALFLVAQTIGAVIFFFGWPETWTGAPAGIGNVPDRMFHSAFFAISAFCNAGFATTTNNMQGLRSHWTTHIVLTGLIVLGGIGMPVVLNLYYVWKARVARKHVIEHKLVRLSLHTKVVLVTTFVVYLLGVLGILMERVFQRHVPLGQALLDAHFLSITARTAGFDTVATDSLGALSKFLLLFLMFIGGSPGSTAGGVKTIVAAVLILAVWAAVRGRPSVHVFRRTIPDEVVRRATVLIVLGLVTIVTITGVLSLTDQPRLEGASEPEVFEQLLFETVSACSTVGLSLGVTADLSDAGKLAISTGMFLGRIGPLVFLVALLGIASKRRARYEYPVEPMIIS